MKTKNIIKIGTLISHYEIQDLIGEGSYGQVYLANEIGTNNKFAIKIEINPIAKESIEHEIETLENIDEIPYFPKVYDSGVLDNKVFFVMELLGSSLSKMMEELDDRHYSLYTSLKISIEMLKSIQSLHQKGFIHRDIKPSNFLIRPNKNIPLCLIDFGLSDTYIDKETGKHKAFERDVKFYGTKRYASVNAHEHTSLSRRDDIISWFYSFVELYSGSLPWVNINNFEMVKETKSKAKITDICYGLPSEFQEIYRIIRCLRYEDEPPYKKIIGLIQSAINNNCSPPYKYDWEDMIYERIAEVSPVNLLPQQNEEENDGFCRI